MKFAVSVTQCVGVGGIGTSAAKTNAAEASRTMPISNAKRRDRINLELHLGRFLGSRLGFEVRLVVKLAAKKSGDDVGRKTLALVVEVARRFIKAHALDGDTIVGSFKRYRQIAECLS